MLEAMCCEIRNHILALHRYPSRFGGIGDGGLLVTIHGPTGARDRR